MLSDPGAPRRPKQMNDVEITRIRLLDAVERTAKELTANLLRVARGAGRPVHVGPQAVRLVDALQAYYDGVGRWPYDEMAAALRLNRDAVPEHSKAMQTIVAGALQYAASDLQGAEPQRVAAEQEIQQGVDQLAELEAAEMQRRAAEEAARREKLINATIKGLRRKAK